MDLNLKLEEFQNINRKFIILENKTNPNHVMVFAPKSKNHDQQQRTLQLETNPNHVMVIAPKSNNHDQQQRTQQLETFRFLLRRNKGQ